MNDQEILNEIEEIEKKIIALKASNQKKVKKSKIVAKKQIIVARKPSIVAKSKIDEAKKKKEEDRVKNVVKLATTMTKNLPEPDFNFYQKYNYLRGEIVDAAFNSALENDVIFTLRDEHNINVTKGSNTFHVKACDLEDEAQKLVKWSGLGYRLNDEKGNEFSHFTLYNLLILKAAFYKAAQDRLKSSDEHLAEIVEAMACEEFKHDATTNRTKVLEKFTAHLVSTTKKLGKQFSKDISGNLYMNCSDQKFGMTKLDPKKVKASFQRIIDNSEVAGKLKSTKDAETLLEGFTKHQEKH